VHRDGESHVRKQLRHQCVFSTHDVLHDPPFPDLDRVSCRNVLIDLDPGSRAR
jgi:two-component system, chemotaxis family, CheB/CheR fusion protein